MSVLATRISGSIANQAQVPLVRAGLNPSNIKRKVIDVFTSLLQNNVESYFTSIVERFKPKNSDFSEVDLDGDLPGLDAGSRHYSRLGSFARKARFYQNFMLPTVFAFKELAQWRRYTEPNQTRFVPIAPGKSKKSYWNMIDCFKMVCNSFGGFFAYPAPRSSKR